ncbi:hypothetical protein CMK15_10425 [Candidatus Poribacteria bacterium]|nr:hypothetical protein [Candidatus Poribacteria bacterium]
MLHGGHSRGILDAILWHGGEATVSREAVQKMSQKERNVLLSFLKSL